MFTCLDKPFHYLIEKNHNVTNYMFQEVYITTYEAALASISVTVSESWRFFLAVFPSIGSLPYDEQREFFRMCCPQFAIIDCFYSTKKIWGGFHQYSMCSVLLCSDLTDLTAWIGQHEGGRMRRELLELIRTYCQDQLTMMVPSFEQADICEKEKHALLALLLTESELRSELEERFHCFIENIRKQTLQELHRFYTEEMGLSEYSTRLGRLYTICLTFREGNVLMREFFRMQVTIFDIFVVENGLTELLM
ncbi:hypothetical protein PMAYCL1PPCAC_14889 [Pristionchus mayeri]|uniref:NR LBD domain-containing protein n=1 Tax=Pristionchus mayeri TaxID=1317129 RepID=A0AAN5CHU8_9BILA|nr:hypothetical protein PMAYCL1PPCAC_14889 [Pristionchus mayeri]